MEFPHELYRNGSRRRVSMGEWDQLLDFVRSITPKAGPGLIGSRTPSATHLSTVGGRRGGAAAHPWKATANAADTVAVAPGRILSYLDGSYTLAEFGQFAGGNVTVTGDGVIYGSIPAAMSLVPIININPPLNTPDGGDVNITLMRIFPDTGEEITVGFAPTLPESNSIFVWEISKVTFEDDIVEVTDQILTHNPILWHFLEPPG